MRKRGSAIVAAMGPKPFRYTWEGTEIQDHLTPEQWKEIDSEISHQMNMGHDRGVAVVFCSLIEDRLKWLVERQFRADMTKGQKNFFFKGAGPLSSAYAQTKLLQALGTIDDRMTEAINLVSEIRNKFAHTPGTIRFSDPSIAERVEKLHKKFELAEMPEGFNSPLHKYGMSCFVIMVALLTVGQRPAPLPASPETAG